MKKAVLFLLLAIPIVVFLYNFCVSKKNKKPQHISNRNELINSTFLELKAETLSKKEITFPTDVSGKSTVLIIAFKGEAQKLVDTWTIPILKKYTNQEINFYEIPMISGGYKIAKGFINKGMRSGVPKKNHGNVATYYGKLKDYKTNLMMNNNKSIYLYLLDKTGKIKYISDAEATETKLTELFKTIEDLRQFNKKTKENGI